MLQAHRRGGSRDEVAFIYCSKRLSALHNASIGVKAGPLRPEWDVIEVGWSDYSR